MKKNTIFTTGQSDDITEKTKYSFEIKFDKEMKTLEASFNQFGPLPETKLEVLRNMYFALYETMCFVYKLCEETEKRIKRLRKELKKSNAR